MAEHEHDLQKLLADRPATGGELAAGPDGNRGGRTEAPPSPTVLDLDLWSRRRGRDLAERWAADGVAEVDEHVVADAHATLFEPEPRLADRPADRQRAAWWQALLDTPEYRALHAQTCLDAGLSQIAAKTVCDQWLAYAQELEQRRQQQPDSGDGDGDGDGEQPAPEPGSDQEPVEQTVARLRSVGRALEQARQDVDLARDLAAGLGMGEADRPLDPRRLAEAFRRVRDSKLLAKIMAMAGRMRRLCQSLQRRKVSARSGEIVGVELGGDLGRLLPRELMQVAGALGQGLQERALYRLLRRRALQYACRTEEPAARGPIVVCVDESGSMRGDKIVAAKGLGLALYWLARHQRRWCALVGFSAGPEGTRLALSPGQPDQAALVQWLTHFYGGGTTLDVPLRTVPEQYWPEWLASGLEPGTADVIVVTDAIVDASDELVDSYRRWAEGQQVKTYGIVVGQRDAGDLAKVCQRWWAIPELDLDSPAVQEVLAI